MLLTGHRVPSLPNTPQCTAASFLTQQHTACATLNNPTLQGIFCRSYMIRLPNGLLLAPFVLEFTPSNHGANMVHGTKERLLPTCHVAHFVLWCKQP